MDTGYILLIISGALLLFIIGGFVFYRLLYNKYLNKRLKGETERRRFFNYKAFAVIMAINICVGLIGFFSASLIQAKTELAHYRARLDELYPRQQLMSDNAVISEFKWLTDGLQEQNLSGYIVTKAVSGDFECYTASAKAAVTDNSLMPSFAVYLRYTGGELINPSVEFKYTYSDWQNESSHTFNVQYLYISRLYHDEQLFSIDIKISVDPQGNKSPQLYSQSHFDFSGK